jgi:hypothetical protein
MQSVMPEENFKILLLIVTCIACLLVGRHLLIKAARAITAGWSSSTWPTAVGTITHSQILPYNDGDYGIDIKYAFTVQDEACQGSATDSGAGLRAYDRQDAEKVVEAYPIGRAVTVYYDPNTKNSLLKPGVSPVSSGMIAFAVLFIGFGLFCGYLAWTGYRSN